MRKNRIIKRTIAIVLGLVLSLGLVANVDFTSNADASAKTEIAGLTTSIMANPISGSGGWSYIYFGKWNNAPFKYRVLNKSETAFGSATMFLDADSLIGEHNFYSSGGQCKWLDSTLRTYLNSTFFNGSFDKREKNAIANSKKATGYDESADEIDDQIFVISNLESVTPSYGYKIDEPDPYLIKNNSNGSPANWWTRSNYSYPVDKYIVVINTSGSHMVHNTETANKYFVSPALNVSLSSIVSLSLVSGTKSEHGAAYKLTVKDSDMSVTTGTVTRNGSTVSVPYSNVTDEATQLSYIITNGTWSDTTGWSDGATKISYGKANTSALPSSGTAIISLPNDFNASTMNVYLIAEEVNGTYETDYASAPVKITIPPHTHNFTYSSDGATITANCSADNCPLTNHQTSFSIVAPTLTTEGGSGSANATLSGVEAFNTATGFQVSANDIKYAGRAGTSYDESATAPTKAGKYTALITVEGKTAELDYEIGKKKEPTPTQHKFLNGDNQVVTYGQPVMFRIEGELSDYNGEGYIEVDGALVPAKYVAATKGSIILTLASDYVSGLKEGKHDVNIYFNDKSHVSTTFTLQSEPSSNTSDTTETTTPTTTPTSSPNTTTKVTAPKTSDSVPFVVVGIVTLTAGIGSVVAYRKHACKGKASSIKSHM